jgi:hypothetical protein
MKRWIRSIGRANSALRQNTEVARQPMISEPLEGRVMMAAQLSASSMLNKFSGSQTGTPTVIAKPASVVGPTSGLLESDDRISKAASKGLDFTVKSDINKGMDVDMYKFTAKAGQHIGFDIDAPAGSKLDAALRLFNGAGQEIAFSDDDKEEFEASVGLDSYIDYTFPMAGTYYVAVSASGNIDYHAITGYGDVNGSTTGKYELKVKKLPPPDLNDQIEEAEEVQTEDFITGKLDTKGDVDMFKFTVEDGQSLGFDIEQLFVDGPADTILRLFDEDGNELAFSDTDLAPDEQNESNWYDEAYIEYTFTSGGTYYIAVSGGRVSDTSTGNDTFDPISGLDDKEGHQGRYGLRITDPMNFNV